MNNNKDSINLRSQEMLTEIYNMRLNAKNRRHHRDVDGRPIWSYDHFDLMFTYYLYNDEGEATEIGDCYMPPVVLAQITALSPLPAAQITDFIVNHHIAYNITRLEVTKPAIVIVPDGPKQIEIHVVSLTNYCTVKSVEASDSIMRPVDCVLPTQMVAPQYTVETPQYTTNTLQQSTSVILQDTLFADRVLASIFANPDIHNTTYLNANACPDKLHTAHSTSSFKIEQLYTLQDESVVNQPFYTYIQVLNTS